MNDVEKIINASPKKMQEMLNSVYTYNSNFVKNEKQEKLLERIIFAMSAVDRRFFVSEVKESYLDTALSIGDGQTISQPSTVARMLLLAELEEGDDVLEIGTGSGWNACLIAYLVYLGSIVSVERLARLKERAEKNLSLLKKQLQQKKPEIYQRLQKINFLAENVFDLAEKKRDIFEKGRVWRRKYNKIIFTAGISNDRTEGKVEALAKELLKDEGALVCPYTAGRISVFKKQQDRLKRFTTRESYVFVPLLD
ncbi:MAG: hypothetical protein AABX71_00590 [Nanoarchaeota archaeon]